MKANIIDFRTKSHRIIQALERNESVELFYHGRLKGILKPVTTQNTKPVQDSDFFGYLKDETESVESMMDKLRRKSRYDF